MDTDNTGVNKVKENVKKIVDEIVRRYPDGKEVSSIEQLEEENPDMALSIRGLYGFFGKPPIIALFQEKGVIKDPTPTQKKHIDIDGIIFTEDMLELIKFPENWNDDTYRVPDGVISIEENAFKGSNLRKIILPDSIEYIGEYAFNLTGYPFVKSHSIELPAKPVKIKELAFDPVVYYKNSGLKDIKGVYFLEFRYKDTTIPVELLGNWKVNSDEIKLADFIETKHIGRKRVMFEDVKTSGYKTFMAFYLALIHEDPESIQFLLRKENELSRNTMYSHLLEHLNSDLIKHLDENASTSRTSTKIDLSKWIIKYLPDETCEIEKYKGKDKLVDIPSEYDGVPITSIGESAFSAEKTKACAEIEKITVPEGIEIIKDKAFYSCSNLIDISFPKSLMQIGKEAFHYCSSLQKIEIPDNVTQIGERAFMCCDQLKDIAFSAQLTTISREMFSCCPNIKRIVLGDSVTRIENGAFSQCTGLEEVVLGDSLQSIGYHAFSICKSLKGITLPNELREIGFSAFSCCESIKRIDIPAKANIDCSYNLVGSCKSLTEINVHDQNEFFSSVDGVLFDKAQKTLISFPPARSNDYIIPDSVEIIWDYAFDTCKSLKTISFPNGLREIGKKSFCLCSELNEVTLPTALERIGEGAFSFSGITRIVIPDHVCEIEESAFSNCRYLESVVFPESVNSIGRGCFKECADIRAYAPSGSYAEKYCIKSGIPLVDSPNAFKEATIKECAGEFVNGKVFAFVRVSDLQAKKAKSIIERLHGVFRLSTVASLDYLVYDPEKNRPASSEYKKAKELIKKGKKIKIITWDEFSEKIWEK